MMKIFMAYKAPNKRIIQRAGNGKFRKTTMEDMGIGGTCPDCQHLLLWKYFGNNPQMPDPRETGYECPHCGYRINRRGDVLEKNPTPDSTLPKEKHSTNNIQNFFQSAIDAIESREKK